MGIETALLVSGLAAIGSTAMTVESQNNARRQSNQAANGAAHDQDVADKKLQAQTLAADQEASNAALKARQRGNADFTKNGTILTSPLGALPQPNQTGAKTLLGQ